VCAVAAAAAAAMLPTSAMNVELVTALCRFNGTLLMALVLLC